MSMNKIYACAIDDDGNVKRVQSVAKTDGGEFRCYGGIEKKLNEFLLDAFIDGYAIAFKDDYGKMSPGFYIGG